MLYASAAREYAAPSGRAFRMDGGSHVRQSPGGMRMLFVADLHYALKQFDWLLSRASEYDAIIIGGDLLELASALEIDVQIVVVEKYLNRLSQQTRLIVSSGNHDGDARSAADESICTWLQDVKSERLFVDGDSVQFGDVLVTVCPWWDGPVSCQQVAALLARDAAKPKTKWVWIHHAPPQDSTVSWTGKHYGGDEFLVKWIEAYQPDAVLSGHIHNAPFVADGSWIDRVGKTWVFNPGRQIGPFPSFLVFDLEQMSMTWVSLEEQEERSLDVPVAG